jgi:hypothetical protein
LDEELLNHRLKNVKVILYIAIPLAIIAVLLFSFVDGEKSEVIGVVVSHQATLHDEGHELNLMVEIPNNVVLAKVRLPKNADIKIGSKVELIANKSQLLNITKYRFVRYVE